MFIVINCLGLPFNGGTIKEKSLGGSETAAYYMAKELAAKGHRVTVFTNSQEEGAFDDVKYSYAGNITPETPLGNRFHIYAENTPHDVLIVQRHPQAFRFNFQAKIKLWWLHDLSLIRTRDEVHRHLWNMTGILAVSEFHKKQICDTWGVDPKVVHAITNGIDLSLFGSDLDAGSFLSPNMVAKGISITNAEMAAQVKLLYTSRPERGLEHLVKPDGIMERLAKEDGDYHLYVCHYENTTPETAAYYDYLKSRCEGLPNVTLLGSLTKQELADVQRQCNALVYPTPGPMSANFEEVSCITAMESMAAGLPFISGKKGALPETCEGSGAFLIPIADGEFPSIKKFVTAIKQLAVPGTRAHDEMVEKQLKSAPKFAWEKSASKVLSIISSLFEKRKSDQALSRHLIRVSDIYPLVAMDLKQTNKLDSTINTEMKECYDFALNDTPYFAEHYKKYYEYEKARGVEYGPEKLDGNGRFEHVSFLVDKFTSAGDTVLDYGCAHGHYTINLAKRFPDRHFVGVDITASNVEKAKAWMDAEKLSNVEFHHDYLADGKLSTAAWETRRVDVVIAAEVLEHVADPWDYVDTLEKYLNEDGQMIITTPYGPWEGQGFEEHWPFRAHLWHFEREDLHELWSHKKDFNIVAIPAGPSRWGDALGSFITIFTKSEGKSGRIDYIRKRHQTVPKQTVSLCMIVRNAEASLRKTIDSVRGIVDEVIIAVDNTTDDHTWGVIDDLNRGHKGIWPAITAFDIESPLKTGFDEARNESIAKANGDWILWMDADEVMVSGENIHKYLINNMYDGYSIPQHHFSVEPLGVLKTDLPCRLFRNNIGMRFFGRVHEHPETKLNDGPGHVMVVPDIHIAHDGYTTEQVRRGRFARNIGLMKRDRKDYPDRILGKFLWIRDASMMCEYELQANGGNITADMKNLASEAIGCWESLLDGNHIRNLIESMDFYTTLSQVLGGGFEMSFRIDFAKYTRNANADKGKLIKANFLKKEHAEGLMAAIFKESTKEFDSRYY